MNSKSLLGLLAAVLLIAGTPAAGRPVPAGADGSSFTIRPDFSHKEIYDVYDNLQKNSQEQFITTDLVLHTGHLLFDYSLRAIEIDKLYGLAEKLSGTMARKAGEMQGSGRRMRLLHADYLTDVNTLQAFFSVPAKILDPKFTVPAHVRDRVQKDLAAMEKHEGFAISATLAHAEDFTQYVPRGHYTRNEQFKR